MRRTVGVVGVWQCRAQYGQAAPLRTALRDSLRSVSSTCRVVAYAQPFVTRLENVSSRADAKAPAKLRLVRNMVEAATLRTTLRDSLRSVSPRVVCLRTALRDPASKTYRLELNAKWCAGYSPALYSLTTVGNLSSR